MVFYKSVTVHRNPNLDIIKISSQPEAFSIVFFIALLIGIVSLPFTEYRNNYMAYIGLLYPIGLVVGYFILSTQDAKFENKTKVSIRKGFDTWSIPFETVTGGYASCRVKTSQASLIKTYYLDFELRVNLPDNKKYSIRNGTANIFHYGFSQWGKEQEKIWAKFNEILDEKGISNLTLE
ncbi:MAG: hypothetical protein ACHWZW_07485 [Spirulina sp.]